MIITFVDLPEDIVVEVPAKINYIFQNLSFYKKLFKKTILKEAYKEYIKLINELVKNS